MTVSPLDSAVYRALFSDEALAALFTDDAQLAAMLRFEVALAKAEAQDGVIPAEAAQRIAAVAADLTIDPATLAADTATTGLPVPALATRLREAVGGEAAQYVHWGATSQDVIDSGLVLRLRDALDLLEARLADLIERLAAQADAHRGTVMAGRTRSQQAAPTTLGMLLAAWLAPLGRHRTRLSELRPRLLTVQFGGAVGTLAALGDKGIAVMETLASELGLAAPAIPWHAQRDAIAELAGWLALVSGSLGKLGQDLILLSQSEVAEVSGGPRGGSSTMPQKRNPVAGETLVALARLNAGLLGTMHQASIQDLDRGGAGWTLEWLALPQMVVAAGASLRHALTVAETLTADPDRMAENLSASDGLILAEAAAFALAAHMPRPDAQALVKDACRVAAEEGRHLMDLLRERTDAPVDWQALGDPSNYLGTADALIDRAIAAARQ